MDNRVLVALSGGVDSSVAVLLLKSMELEPRGVHFIMSKQADESAHAKSAALKMGVDLEVLDLTTEFDRTVVEYFVNSYLNGLTPNPCVFCNRNMKFKSLFDTADRMGIETVATGHYAHIEKSGSDYYLKKSQNPSKDQSYVLYSLKKEWLSRLIFPIGSLTKEQAREMARETGLENAEKPDSQDVCFIPSGSYVEFIQARNGFTSQSGSFVNMQGQVIGTHGGMLSYTIGQRKGLKVGFGEKVYVVSKDAKSNTVTLGHDSDLYSSRLRCHSVNMLIPSGIPDSIKVNAKVRYRMNEQPATVFFGEDNTATVEFQTPQRAFTPGQSVVFYDGDYVLGGGVIE